MEITLATIDDIVQELRTRPLAFALIVKETCPQVESVGRLAISDREFGQWLVESACVYLRMTEDDGAVEW